MNGGIAVEQKNRCDTCFRMTGKFDPDRITEILGLTPGKAWKVGDLRKNGTKYDFASWETGRCSSQDPCTENQQRHTLAPLLDKIGILNALREQFELEFFLEIIPTVYAEETAPCLAPPMDVIDFCHATRTKIDIDLTVLTRGND